MRTSTWMAVAAAAALAAGAAEPAAAAIVEGPAAVLQQGRGNGGKQGGEARGREARAQEPRGREAKGQEPRAPQRESREPRGRSQERRAAEPRGREEARPARPAPAERARGRSAERAEPAARRAEPRRETRARDADDGLVRRAARTVRASAAERREARRGYLGERALRERVAELPPPVRALAASPRRSERMAAGALARARARGMEADALRVRDDDGRVRLLNRRGELLLDLDDDRARELGAWRLRRLGDRRPTGGSPAFCRSGAGHPVWGREWCLDKGFGLGSRAGTLWSRGRIEDVIFRRDSDRVRLDRGGLLDVLGAVVFGRLALQSVVLGFDQPLTGAWVAQPDGPRILRVHSGDREVAELVDLDRDDRPEVLFVVQPVW